MKKVDLKKHTNKYRSASENARHRNYPNTKLAKRGSLIGLSFGSALTTLGVYDMYNHSDDAKSMCMLGVLILISSFVTYRI
ncbi:MULTISPECIES: hypothetical protein [unclassified Exiguobacterium]|uniref:hypothetical protein n=1 Tax=unclassified Exiguobacterium TaxID=2644629 RepID=UPI00135B5FBC|nr:MULTISPECIES: hypothetical protein [unclassified Exiguobacterium]